MLQGEVEHGQVPLAPRQQQVRQRDRQDQRIGTRPAPGPLSSRDVVEAGTPGPTSSKAVSSSTFEEEGRRIERQHALRTGCRARGRRPHRSRAATSVRTVRTADDRLPQARAPVASTSTTSRQAPGSGRPRGRTGAGLSEPLPWRCYPRRLSAAPGWVCAGGGTAGGRWPGLPHLAAATTTTNIAKELPVEVARPVA